MFLELIYAKELSHELLSEYEEHILLQEAQSGDADAREKLILSNLRLVHSIVKKYVNVERGITSDDLMADGIVGLCKAIDQFDLSFGTRLSTYATLVIHSTVRRSSCLHGTIRLPEDVRTQVRQINRVKADLLREGLPITTDTIAARTQISVEDIDRLKHLDSDVMYVFSFDMRVDGNEGEQALSDIVPDPASEEMYQRIEMEATLEFFLSKLNNAERFLIEGSYGIGTRISTEEIALTLDVHPRYIPKMLESVMERLRRLGKALRGSPEEIQMAVETPEVVMAGVSGQIHLLPPQEITKPGKLRKPKSKKIDNRKMKDAAEQLKLFRSDWNME